MRSHLRVLCSDQWSRELQKAVLGAVLFHRVGIIQKHFRCETILLIPLFRSQHDELTLGCDLYFGMYGHPRQRSAHEHEHDDGKGQRLHAWES